MEHLYCVDTTLEPQTKEVALTSVHYNRLRPHVPNYYTIESLSDQLEHLYQYLY